MEAAFSYPGNGVSEGPISNQLHLFLIRRRSQAEESDDRLVFTVVFLVFPAFKADIPRIGFQGGILRLSCIYLIGFTFSIF